MGIRLLALVMLLASMPAFAAHQADTPANRRAAAERYLKVAPMGAMMDDTIEETARSLPADRRAAFVAFMKHAVRVDVVRRAALKSMVRHFTADELDAMAAFYGSPEGRSALKKFGAYMSDMAPVIQQEMLRAYQQYRQDHPQAAAAGGQSR